MTEHEAEAKQLRRRSEEEDRGQGREGHQLDLLEGRQGQPQAGHPLAAADGQLLEAVVDEGQRAGQLGEVQQVERDQARASVQQRRHHRPLHRTELYIHQLQRRTLSTIGCMDRKLVSSED